MHARALNRPPLAAKRMSRDHPAEWLQLALQIDAICEEFEAAWKAGETPTIETYLAKLDQSGRAELVLELIGLDIDYRRRGGELVLASDYSARFSDITAEQLEQLLELSAGSADDTQSLLAQPSEPQGASPGSRFQPNLSAGGSEQNNPARERVHGKNLRFIRYFGDYELLEQWAQGGMGTVYRARQTSLNRIVAVKTINSGVLARHIEVARFTKEAKAAGALRHPHIVPVYEVGQHEGIHFYSMAFVEGSSLAERLECWSNRSARSGSAYRKSSRRHRVCSSARHYSSRHQTPTFCWIVKMNH